MVVARIAGSAAIRSTPAPSPAAIGKAFDRKFPYSNAKGGLTKLPAPVNAAKLPGEAGKIYASIVSEKNYTNVKAYAVTVGGEKVLALTGSNGKPPSDFGLALFTSTGKQLAFKDVLGLNQWQINGKDSHFALAAGLPGFPKSVPQPKLNAGLTKLAADFEKDLPWSDDAGAIVFPKSAAFNGALPAGSAALKMSKDTEDSKTADYDFTEKYKVNVAGKDMYVVIGVADATYDVGLFDMKGRSLMFNQGMNSGAWVP
jgi:hypothetical protein